MCPDTNLTREAANKQYNKLESQLQHFAEKVSFCKACGRGYPTLEKHIEDYEHYEQYVLNT